MGIDLVNSAEDFTDDFIRGFAAAHADRVRRVPGGLVRRLQAGSNEVAVVIGGGTGHFPAFAGLVGEGLAHGAALGNVFASPSAQQVFDVAVAAHRGGGVLLAYGNYAGDVLNFDEAQRLLRQAGIDCRTVRVTDDIASRPLDQREERRGIAGDLPVFTLAGAAAARGLPLDDVERVARAANDATRTFGIAYSGCTLPGEAEPLFTVPMGQMALGLGIHGEPGLELVPRSSAAATARVLVDRVLAEFDCTRRRALIIVNSLGGTSLEELFVLYGGVEALLSDAGIEIVAVEVGEFCTSFDMAGVSLTITLLDDELEDLWADPSDAPAFRKSPRRADRSVDLAREADSALGRPTSAEYSEASHESRRIAALIATGFELARDAVEQEVGELGRLDAIAGDGDHGIGMQRGVRAASKAAASAAAAGAGAHSTLNAAATAWANRAGGTSGMLWGAALAEIAAHLDDETAPTDADLAAAVVSARNVITSRGGASPGDKTLVDALHPLAQTFAARVSEGEPLATSWGAAADAAANGALATTSLTARRGRAKTHDDRSIGTPDPGAVSLALIARAVGGLAAGKDTQQK
ncbi:dihydroxyacetone kinase family protein [Microbacterium sp. NPDC058389]|uniref:dihydroxyacetone kinase family protein n=1 Tax=Microbacterium sp. NPDC058389 TaxID=3346475 RepID=UPI00365EE5AC